MAFTVDAWSVAVLLTKWFSYICFVSLAGGVYALRLDAHVARRHHSACALHTLIPFKILFSALALLGLVLSAISLLLQVGVINQNGVAGMFDGFMLRLIAQSNIGGGTALRALAFLLLGISSVTMVSSSGLRRSQILGIALYLTGLLSFASSFAYLGHIAPQAPLAKAAIVLHIGAVGLWIGALLPLWVMCWRQETEYLTPSMKKFGEIAWWVIVPLVLGGGYLVVVLIASPGQLLFSPYGLMLSTKLLLVLSLLALAASNKFIHVKRLHSNGTLALKRSIGVEIVLALIVLLVTAALTTFAGPGEMPA